MMPEPAGMQLNSFWTRSLQDRNEIQPGKMQRAITDWLSSTNIEVHELEVSPFT